MNLLADFLNAIIHDPRIGPTHISLYVVLHQIWIQHSHSDPLLIKRQSVMKIAKIGAVSTYHRIINDLVQGGYITYEGRFDRKGSKIFMVCQKE